MASCLRPSISSTFASSSSSTCYRKPISFSPSSFLKFPKMDSHSNLSIASSSPSFSSSVDGKKNPDRKLPILLFDVMDTIVRDPFYHDIPAFF
ncbi:hypothetical protein MKW94_020343, partial [Papaver nudicaule]|nr:hypothetical protein [Papaver nudicaule]